MNANKNDLRENCIFILQMLNVAERRLTIPLLAIMLLSLVQSKMIQIGEYFRATCILYGQSQIFKTALASLFFCFKNGRGITASFESTKVAIIRKIASVRDAVAIIDDLKPPSTRAMMISLMEKLEMVIRLGSDNNEGYQTASPHGTVKTIKFCGITLISAEDILITVGSSIGRTLILEMNKWSVNKEWLTYYQTNENHEKYMQAIEDYIIHISEVGVEKFCANLQNRFLQERDTLRNVLIEKNVIIDNRTNDACVFLYLSLDEYLKYALNIEAIEDGQYANLKSEITGIFLRLMEEQAERISAQSEINLFIKALAYLLDTKEARIEPLQSRNTGYSSADSKTAIGFVKNGLVYLKNNVAYQRVSSHYKRLGKEFPISESTLRKQLNDNGYLVAKTHKSLIHRLYVNQESYQCIAFEEVAFNKLKGGKDDGIRNDSEVSSDWLLRENSNVYLGRED